MRGSHIQLRCTKKLFRGVTGSSWARYSSKGEAAYFKHYSDGTLGVYGGPYNTTGTYVAWGNDYEIGAFE